MATTVTIYRLSVDGDTENRFKNTLLHHNRQSTSHI